MSQTRKSKIQSLTFLTIKLINKTMELNLGLGYFTISNVLE